MKEQKTHGIIYKATSKISGKFYIGQTIKSLNTRINDHINDALSKRDNMYFHKAIRKYGKENFEWETIAKCDSLEELNRIEVEMIKGYDTFKNGYNLTKGGEGKLGSKLSKETRKKLSNARIGKTHSEETKKKLSKINKGEKGSNYGKHWSEKIREKMSLAQIGSKSPKSKKYIVTTPEGKEIFVHGLRNFCKNYKEEKLNYKYLIRSAQGKQKYHKEFRCKYFVE